MRASSGSPSSIGRRSTGQAMIEFALILPVVLLMLLGLIDLGRAFVYGVSAQEGARQSARLASTASYDITVTDAAVLGRFVAASNPALTGCSAVTTSQTCSTGTWTLSISVVNGGSTYSSIALARAANALSGATASLKARGSVALFPGINTGSAGLTLSPISVQGMAVMVVL